MPKIEEIATQRVLVPIRRERIVTGVGGTHDRSPFLIARKRAGGIEGGGEVSGTYVWSGEGFETAEAAIQNVIAPSLIGLELSPNPVRKAMEKAIAGFAFTKAGIEMAR